MSEKNSVFMKAKCLSTKKIYYIRYDYNAVGRWILSETLTEEGYIHETHFIKNENNDEKDVDISSAYHGPQYKGCPYCHNRGFVTCSSCKELHCFDSESNGFLCPSDGKWHKLSGGYISSLKGICAGQ